MKQSNAYLIIFLSILVLAITIIVSLYRDAENRRTEGERFLFPKLSVATDENSLKLLNNISIISITSDSKNFIITRDNDNWFLPNLANFPVPLDKIKRVIVGIAQLETIEPKTKNPDLHGELGLNNTDNKDNAAKMVTLIDDNNEKIASILVGNDSKFGNETRYVRKPSDNQSWLVWRNFDVPESEIDWLESSLFSVHRGRVADIKIIHTDGQEVNIKRANYSEQYFKIQDLDDDTLPINPYVGNQLGSSLDSIPLLNINSKSNIEFTNNATNIIITTFDGLKLILKNENINGVNWITFEASADLTLRRELPKDGPINVGLPEMDSFEEIVKEADKLNTKFQRWAFSLKKDKHQLLHSRIEDLTKKRDLDIKE